MDYVLYITAIVVFVREAIGLYNDVRSLSENEKNACCCKRPKSDQNEEE